MVEHVPAWRRITIKKNQEQTKENDNDQEDDPLNITTHLATGFLDRKQKQKIIRRANHESNSAIELSHKKFKNDKKKKKLSKEKKDIRKQMVLKDQLKYLIEFYLNKVNPNNLPDSLYSLSSVRSNYSAKFNPVNQNDLDESSIIEIWKFSKQKQNWLIKNFFNIEEIPVEYDPLLLSYFKELKGPAIKDHMSATCRAKTNEWNEYIEKQDEKMTQIVQDDNGGEKIDKPTIKKHDENAIEAKKQRKEEVLSPPDKRIVNRSQELLKLWRTGSLLELKRFYDD